LFLQVLSSGLELCTDYGFRIRVLH
jgi:hypothetical protein